MSATPTIPNIAPVQTAQPLASADTIGALLAPIAAKANADLPDPYSEGKQVAEPHIHPVVPFQPHNNQNQPVSGAAQDLRRARRKNSIADLGNTIGSAGQKIQEMKQQKLKDHLTDVMKSKQNIANAEAVLARDPGNAMAKKVLDANKEQLNTILSDPKIQKQMAKALDVSFTDSDKNKTPEVQAYQKAMKEFKEAGPFNSDNPAEHQVSQMAKQVEVAGTSKMGAPNTSVSAPNAPAASVAKSTTPYADAALKKDTPTIEANPLYAQAVKERADAQKQVSAIIPKLIDANVKTTIQAAKDGNAAALAVYKAQAKMVTDIMDNAAKQGVANTRSQAEIKSAAIHASAQIRSAQIHADATIKASENKMFSEEQKLEVKKSGADVLDKQISSMTNNLKSYGTRANDINSDAKLSKEEKTEKLKVLALSYDADTKALAAVQEIRADKLGIIPPSPEVVKAITEKQNTPSLLAPIYNMMNQGLHNSLGASDGGDKSSESSEESKPELESVGDDDSDESDDSDNY